MSEFKPLPKKHRAAYQLATARGNLWDGAVRTAKTVSSLMRWIEFVRNGPAGNLAMIGKTERTLKRNAIDVLVEMLGTKRCRYVAGTGEIFICGRRVYVAGANNVSAVEKIRGMTLAGFYGDELSTWPEDVFSMARTRLSVLGAQWFGTTNPGSSRHYLKTQYIDKCRLHLRLDGTLVEHHGLDRHDLNVFSFGLDDNPFLPADYVASLKREYTGIFYKRFILGQWAAAEGSIFEMFDPERHVVAPDKIPKVARWPAVGVDYGTMNPFHALDLGMGTDRKLYVTGEYRHDGRATRRQMTDIQYVSALRMFIGQREIENICVDPSAASFRVQAHAEMMRTVPASNAVLDGIRLLCTMLSADNVRFSSSCRHLLSELPAYAWDEHAGELGEDKPVKDNDHGIDALRYAAATTRHTWFDDMKWSA